ncbi:hypothetical protein COB64_03205 [Candidatus Wolfebacteria bacterium]|nr:MAG: hypothetical protein COB64_03205 [Candidatus Wolfebacteria bacterium]
MRTPLHPEKPIFEYNYIDDGIYIGTNQCCQTHFNEMLLKEGITSDFSLEKDKIDQPFGADYYIWVPIENHTAPTQKQLDFSVETLDRLVKSKDKVYLHCQNGHGRAPTIAVAYFIKTRDMSVDDAIAFVKDKRPTMHIADTQKNALQEYYKRVHKK